MSPTILIDDDEEIRTQLKWALNKDYDVVLAGDRAKAIEKSTAKNPMVTMLDLGLPQRPNEPAKGLAALSEILALDSSAKVIIVSGQGEKENALRAVGAGAYDFFCKPVELDELRYMLRRCFHVAELEREFRELQKNLQPDMFEGMLGTSPQMQGVFAMIRKVAASSAPVLLLGESGTGMRRQLWRFTGAVGGKPSHLSQSTAARFPRASLKANSSATRRVHLPAHTPSARD